MHSNLDALYLEAESDIKNNNFVDALKKYESILMDEPGNGPTLNSMGWIYKTQVEDYVKAETYYKACIKANPSYPHAYSNYAILLTDLERFEELVSLLQRCFEVPSMDKSAVYLRLGFIEELKLNIKEAIVFYERAILISLNDDKIKECNEHIQRCQMKLELSKKHSKWLDKMVK